MGQVCQNCQAEFELKAVAGGSAPVAFCPGCGTRWEESPAGAASPSGQPEPAGGAIAVEAPPPVAAVEPPARATSNPLIDFLENRAEKADMKLPVLPEVAQQIMQMARDPEVEIKTLAEFVSQDQVISGKVLKLANSALYRGFAEVTSIAQAIPRIGLNTLGANVLTIATQEVYTLEEPRLRKILSSLWDHALSTATAAHSIARATRYHDVDKAFVAGLLHDVGKVVILHLLEENRDLVQQIVSSEDLIEEAFEAYHCKMGAILLQRWNLSADLVEAVEATADPRQSKSARTMAAIVHVANLVSDKLGIGWRADQSADPAGSEWTEALGLDAMRLASVEVEIEDLVAEMKRAF
jgi:putative nucleotidyltransferase with HDIG domain